MTEKFEVIFYGDVINCVRDETGKEYNLHETITILNEQQATIRRLQDLCGESDGENAKLRIENKKLQEEIRLLKPTNIEQYEQIQKLQEENEQLRQKLECCEYEHFKKELDKIHERVEKGDLSDFCTLTISDKGLEHWNGVLK